MSCCLVLLCVCTRLAWTPGWLFIRSYNSRPSIGHINYNLLPEVVAHMVCSLHKRLGLWPCPIPPWAGCGFWVICFKGTGPSNKSLQCIKLLTVHSHSHSLLCWAVCKIAAGHWPFSDHIDWMATQMSLWLAVNITAWNRERVKLYSESSKRPAKMKSLFCTLLGV